MYLVKIRFGQFKMICVFKSFEEKAIFKFKEGALFTLLSKKTVCIILISFNKKNANKCQTTNGIVLSVV